MQRPVPRFASRSLRTLLATQMSVHSPPANGKAQNWPELDCETALDLEFQLALAIITSSRANILGHPMGMVIKHFNLKPLEHLYKLARACREAGKAFELNSRYCPNPDDWVSIVQQAECKVSFGSDAHSTSEVGSSWHVFYA